MYQVSPCIVMISLYQLVLFLKQLPIMQKNSWIPRSQGEGVTKDLLGFPKIASPVEFESHLQGIKGLSCVGGILRRLLASKPRPVGGRYSRFIHYAEVLLVGKTISD